MWSRFFTFLLTQRTRLAEPCRHLDMFVKSTEKFSSLSKNIFSSKNEVLSEYYNPILSFVSSPFLS
eukprot:UN24787